MGFLSQLFGKKELFTALSDREKREALDLAEQYLQSILDSRRGDGVTITLGGQRPFLSRLTDDDIRSAIEIVRLQKKAMAASERDDHGAAAKYYEEICARAPFDAVSLMSLGGSICVSPAGPHGDLLSGEGSAARSNQRANQMKLGRSSSRLRRLD